MRNFVALKTVMHKYLLKIKRLLMPIKIESNLKELIDTKANEMNKYGESLLYEVSEYIKQLNLFIDGRVHLSNDEIESKFDYLVGWFTLTLEHPIDAGLRLLRAVKYQENIDTACPCYDRVSRLSYIPIDSGITPNIGRLNKQGDSVYYGCVYFDDRFGGINVAFSEVGALEHDRINILKSKTTDEIKLNFIGFMDYVFRESKPYFISNDTYEYYKSAYEYEEQRFDKNLFVAFQICDAFFADILSRKESGRLYDVTSVLASVFLDGNRSDGILYTSVQAKGSPVVVLKPSVVDQKVKHESAECYKITKSYGYAKYYAIRTHNGTVRGDDVIWKRVSYV